MRVALPDCTGHEDPFTLSEADRRELVRRIAEDGPGAIDDFIREREEQGDSAIARRVRKLKEELLRRAEELRRRLAGDFAQREEQLEAEHRARVAELQDRERMLRADLDRFRAGDRDAMLSLLRGDRALGIVLDADVVARPPWWRRALAAIARFLRLLLAPLLWLLRKVTPSPSRARPPPPSILVPTDRAGDLYLADPTFRAAVKRKLRAAPPAERIRRAWERLLGLEDYESLARKAMAAMEAERLDALREEREASRHRMESELAGIIQREQQTDSAFARDQEALRAEQEAEARRIEEALRELPEKEVKEAIVDELQAAGLLRETGGVLLPTLQFMDRFAALVYQEESLGAGGAGAEGEYAEGEGHYRREPLRSAIEVSRMDVLATMLRARSRHPHVRHIFDEDVVVHREERAGILQVVLVVDRSGSMEEHGRMLAAKRATLALHHAVKRANPRNHVDVLLMDTSVRKATLREAWDTEPTGFTNHGAAFRLARALCERRGRTLVYLITDGLPEAYTKDGEDVAGHPDKAMAYAKQQAALLARERGLEGFVMLLLEPKDERYVKAAEALAKEAKGRVVPVDPDELARTLLRSFEERPVAAHR